MKKKQISVLSVPLLFLMSQVASALDESEVESVIEETSREAVAGNLLIWVLCTVAFLKVSQKIDSYLSALGVSVGRTGSSMIGEQMLIGRVIGSAARGAGGIIGSILNRTKVSSAGPAAGPDFNSGIAAKLVGPAAVASATGKANSLTSLAGGAVLDSSIRNGGRFAASVVGAVATGNISSVGSITGQKATEALSSYLGYASGVVPSEESGPVPSSAGAYVPGEDYITENGGYSAIAAAMEPSLQYPDSTVPSQPPSFRDVEIGGGRITGYELASGDSEERQFAMYHAKQYLTPSGPYETVQTADGESWYKQYAQPAVRKTPYQEGTGKIRFHEEIVPEMPQVPKRKDKV